MLRRMKGILASPARLVGSTRLFLCCMAAAFPAAELPVKASGHGPVFGLATPTNAKGAWVLDLGLMGRKGEADPSAMLRGMLSYGVTQDLMASFSAPLVLQSAPLAPGRITGMMPGSADVEGILAWRFHRRGVDVGSRFESTLYGGVILAGPQKPAGMLGDLSRATGFWLAAATGYASRGHYLLGRGRIQALRRVEWGPAVGFAFLQLRVGLPAFRMAEGPHRLGLAFVRRVDRRGLRRASPKRPTDSRRRGKAALSGPHGIGHLRKLCDRRGSSVPRLSRCGEPPSERRDAIRHQFQLFFLTLGGRPVELRQHDCSSI